MLDPVWAFETLIKHGGSGGSPTTSLPTHHATSTLEPTSFPTVHPDVPEHLDASKLGHVTLWVIFWAMAAFTTVYCLMSMTIPVPSRPVFFTAKIIFGISTLTYLAMATNMGYVHRLFVLVHEHKHSIPDVEHHIFRQFFWARHVEAVLTQPLIVLILGMVGGLSGAHIVATMFATFVMAFARLVGSFGTDKSASKWGWYAIACLAFLQVVYIMFVHGRRAAAARGDKAIKYFDVLCGYMADVWTAYFVIWGIAEGSRHLSVDGEIIAYAVLDVLEKPLFICWLTYFLWKVPDFGVKLGGFWTEGFSNEGQIRVGDD